MSSDRIFFEHGAPKKRKRRRLIHTVDPETRRRLRKKIKWLPPELRGQIAMDADSSHVSAESVMLYYLIAYLFDQTHKEQLRLFREMFPYASDARIERGLTGLKARFDAEIRSNRKRMKS